jgi:hypothetical protein
MSLRLRGGLLLIFIWAERTVPEWFWRMNSLHFYFFRNNYKYINVAFYFLYNL